MRKAEGHSAQTPWFLHAKDLAVARFCKIKARVRDDFIIRAFQLIGEPGKVFYFGPSPKVLKNERLRKAKTLSTLIHIVLCTSQSLHLRSAGQNKRLKHVHRDAVVIITK
ncbi:hypothetical protein DTO045G8_79 [Paecilomyces variotii]|nr:hypothetical protein DTO045G8_79 [Paecilomyces variotii]